MNALYGLGIDINKIKQACEKNFLIVLHGKLKFLKNQLEI